MAIHWGRLQAMAAEVDLIPVVGRITGALGLVLEAAGPRVSLQELCYLKGDGLCVPAEVVGFRDDKVMLMPLAEADGVRPGWAVHGTGSPLRVPTGMGLMGRILDGLGRPLDGGGALVTTESRPIMGQPPPPLSRQRIKRHMTLGVRALDGLLTVGLGQRVGVFAGSGVGKSTLLGMIASSAASDCNVIALVGERGREVREFIERDLGAEGLKRSVVVVATGDQLPLVRIRAALTATTIAESFRDQGMDVLLMMDSVTRMAQAQREVGLSVGEPPATRGYTPSVFSLLPRVLERSGTGTVGSITGIYTVLVDGDDMDEPVADTVRGILDGHVVLSRKLAQAGQFPAVDVLSSVSRVMPEITTPQHQALARRFRALLAARKEAEDLIQIGAYQPGSNPLVDEAIQKAGAIRQYLEQPVDQPSRFDTAVTALRAICGEDGP